MENFETRKSNYIKKLKDNPDLLRALYESIKDRPEEFIKMIEPSNEDELEMDEYIISYFSDLLLLSSKWNPNDCTSIYFVPIEKNEFGKFIIDIFDILNNKGQDDINNYLQNIDPATFAKISYDYFFTISSSSDYQRKLYNYVIGLLGYDLNDDIQSLKFDAQLDIITNLMTKDVIDSNKSLDFQKTHSESIHNMCIYGRYYKAEELSLK